VIFWITYILTLDTFPTLFYTFFFFLSFHRIHELCKSWHLFHSKYAATLFGCQFSAMLYFGVKIEGGEAQVNPSTFAVKALFYLSSFGSPFSFEMLFNRLNLQLWFVHDSKLFFHLCLFLLNWEVRQYFKISQKRQEVFSIRYLNDGTGRE